MKTIKSKVDLQEVFLAQARQEVKVEYEIEREVGEEFDWEKRKPEGPSCEMITAHTENVN